MTEHEHQNPSNMRKQQKQLDQSKEKGIRMLKWMTERQQLRHMNFSKEKKEKEQKRKSRLGDNMRLQTKSGVQSPGVVSMVHCQFDGTHEN